jgi:aminopeptidase N
MHVPVRLGLVGESGRALPLTLEGENAPGPDERVLELTGAEQKFVFVDVNEEPLLSFGRKFSAPATFKVAQSAAERAALMARDADSFNRWQASQVLATDLLLDPGRYGVQNDRCYIDAIGKVLAQAEEDAAFAAQMLSLPLENELASQAEPPVDPTAIHLARWALIHDIAAAHAAPFEALYKSLSVASAYSPDAKSAGRRALRNACLRYLTANDDEPAATLADAHYRGATNMTDMVAGLAALSRMDSPKRDAAFAHFHDRYKNDPLVLDKWMSLQAGSPRHDTVDRVRSLMDNPAFDIKNPNRVRALVSAFSGNQVRFHAVEGSGYALVGETIRTLDKINAMVAARMAGAFETWRRFDPKRQALMRRELETMVKTPGISSNLFEVVTKMID